LKITLSFEPTSQIPSDAKLAIIRRILKAAKNPVEFVELVVESPFIVTDKP